MSEQRNTDVQTLPDPPGGEYQTILVDLQTAIGCASHNSAVDDVINELTPGLPGATAKHAHLYVRTTTSYAVEAKELIEAVGFDYSRGYSWTSPDGLPSFILHQWADQFGSAFSDERYDTEAVLIGSKRGPELKIIPGVDDKAFAGRNHREKRDAVYRMAEHWSPGPPGLEVFTDTQRPEWDSWSDYTSPFQYNPDYWRYRYPESTMKTFSSDEKDRKEPAGDGENC